VLEQGTDVAAGLRVYRIHGRDDRFVPASRLVVRHLHVTCGVAHILRQRPADDIVESGGHALPLSHSEQVSAALNRLLQG
jgi:pimeloyl-ACP methyl ester carboxylesterase